MLIDRYYTLEETAKILHRSKHTIVREINKGIIPTHPDFNHIVPKEYIDNWDIESTETCQNRRQNNKKRTPLTLYCYKHKAQGILKTSGGERGYQLLG